MQTYSTFNFNIYSLFQSGSFFEPFYGVDLDIQNFLDAEFRFHSGIGFCTRFYVSQTKTKFFSLVGHRNNVA